MSAGLVSTIIPVYNRGRMLRQAVTSVLEQTYKNFEIIIVDDQSTDDTPRVIEQLCTEDSRIRSIRRPNGGPGLARESGRQMADGEFIQYLDSDDLLIAEKFQLQIAALRAQPECGVAYGITRYRDSEGREIVCDWKPANQNQHSIFPSFLLARWWETVSPLFRREVTDQAGPWTDLRLEEDWEYDCRVGALGVRLAFVPEVIAEHRDHPEARLSRGAGSDPSRLLDRARAHQLIAGHAHRAGVDTASAEFQQFAREVFHLARQCGAAGMDLESRRLVEAARGVSSARDLRLYQMAGRALGWRNAGRAAAWIERLR